MSNIVCAHVDKNYGAINVIKDFNLEVADREFIVFLGPSGCGKSTLLRMIAGLEEISGGDVMIGGTRVNELEPRDRGVAMVFQNYALYPHMTIYDNIAFGLKRMKVPKAEIDQRIRAVSATLGLDPYLERKPTELSGGQQQRVAIARAMIKTPKVFLFDEPLSNLDAKLRNHMRIEIARLHQKLQTTTIYVTHDQLEAMTLADRIVLMKGGAIEQIGTPAEIYERPRTLFVAGFIGTPNMNFLDVTAHSDRESWRLEGDGFRFRASRQVFELREGQELTLGVRPSALVSCPHVAGAENLLSGSIDLVEFHGDDALVSFQAAGTEIGALVPAATAPTPGMQVTFSVKSESLHLFDSTGLSMRRPTPVTIVAEAS
ncbi:ABC transporter ATP-binding protein [Sinorhizobium terangae]|uniref:sn-glycerol-3-phosphate ABC transporter ATP-binding protein UgpC n=1 Tax=Sinorhizobium terangae TaxID=110322 RepID=A0A6N7LDC0_SINTE|nr:sn-glycerol-3-phosphate ABC transporter ATP-binding protein UgpC [Sinorhizobium terangae]MBB4186233.1 multiple sugar transport system ATP-binding protein [Sinorhizobium terangae]MQX15853.1 sn-glycerol-3-phosphate ABC transporter ATP-binding protein UgpC [Sinorhizobium terangae]MQX19075.1 sn-glycerol-3-phosphate ABC transporter ATP-binding protein UgpC [Sinorhizobium terangae]WFU51113.1 sn-glycerol-3-phosphate ABC transporter ATP-binding protein UgpC [Sinorhizobium terangae]